MRKIVSMLVTGFIFSLSVGVFAASSITIKNPPILDEATESSLKISWEKQTNALGYYIYYGKNPANWKTYESSVPDFIDSTGGTITSLDPDTKYYVAIVAVDENGEESGYSPEINFDTKKAGTSPKLSVKEVEVVSSHSLNLLFNVDLDNSTNAQREFKLIDQTNGGEKEVTKSEIKNGKNVIVTLWSDMLPNTKYELTVLGIQDKNGKSIESWVDGIISFISPSIFPTVEQVNTTNAVIEEIPPLNSGSAEEDVVEKKSMTSGMSGQNVQLDNIKKTVTSNVAKESTNLPQTWPEHIILLIISLLVGALVFMYTKKYQSSL